MEQLTIREIAKLCGVGVSTVSRAINNHPDINPETKQMILDTVRQYNYVPNNSARNLKRTDSNTVAVLVKGVSNPFFAVMIRMLEQDIIGRQYLFVLQQVEEEENELEVALQLTKEKRLKGIVFLGGAIRHDERLLRQLSVPYVFSTVNAELPEDGGEEMRGAAVAIDDEAESFRMTEYLIGCGHRRIAILTAFAEDASIGRLRLDGYRRALETHGIAYDESLVIHMDRSLRTYTMGSGYRAASALLDSGRDFSCIYAISDTLAVGACKAVFDRGRRVPGDISVAGFDGLDIARYYEPSLTTVEQPAEEMARETIRALFALINGTPTAGKYIFEARIREGASVRRIAQ